MLEVNFVQRLRGKEEWSGPWEHQIWFRWYRHLSSDHTKPYSLIQTWVEFKPTIFAYLLIIIIYQKLQFLDVGFQIMDWISVWWSLITVKEKKLHVIGFQLHDKAVVLILLIMFSRNISFRSETSSSVRAVLNSSLQRSVTCKYENIEKSSPSRG